MEASTAGIPMTRNTILDLDFNHSRFQSGISDDEEDDGNGRGIDRRDDVDVEVSRAEQAAYSMSRTHRVF